MLDYVNEQKQRKSGQSDSLHTGFITTTSGRRREFLMQGCTEGVATRKIKVTSNRLSIHVEVCKIYAPIFVYILSLRKKYVD